MVQGISLLKALITKKEFNAALLVVSDPKALGNAIAIGKLEEFITMSISVFIALGNKTSDAFTFLASIEGSVSQNSVAYEKSIGVLIEHILTRPKREIEQSFLSSNYTMR